MNNSFAQQTKICMVVLYFLSFLLIVVPAIFWCYDSISY